MARIGTGGFAVRMDSEKINATANRWESEKAADAGIANAKYCKL